MPFAQVQAVGQAGRREGRQQLVGNRYLLRHGRRHWCSVRCGDRARAARAYARRTGAATD